MRGQARLCRRPCSGGPCGAWLSRSPRGLSMCRSAASQGSLLLQHGVCPYLCEQNAIPQRLVLRSCLW